MKTEYVKHGKQYLFMIKRSSNQGGLNKKKIQLNYYKIFSILIFNEPFIRPKALSGVN